jgi:hypothetical protein
MVYMTVEEKGKECRELQVAMACWLYGMTGDEINPSSVTEISKAVLSPAFINLRAGHSDGRKMTPNLPSCPPHYHT